MNDKILKYIAFGLRNEREKDQELVGHCGTGRNADSGVWL